MSKTVPAAIAAAFDRSRRARRSALSLVAFCAALAGPALAGQDYPAGLFENSPVVGPGGQPAATAPATQDPSAGSANAGSPPAPYPSAPADAGPPPAPYPSGPADAGPPPYPYPSGRADAGPPPYGYQPPDDYCAGIASRIFANLAEVRQAHALCDRYRRRPPPGY